VNDEVLQRGAAALEWIREGLTQARPRVRAARVGRVVRAGDGVAAVQGLQRPLMGELLDVEGTPARVEALLEHEVRLVLLGDASHVESGSRVRRGGRVLDVPAGLRVIGRVVDPMGRPLDERGALAPGARIPVERRPVALAQREPVSRPLRTGRFVLDTMIPIGRGQRQLVIGDRSTGKSELCLDILAAQDRDVVCVYVAIGRRGSEVASTVDWLRERGVLEHGFVVATHADDPLGLIHLAPYAATAMAEDLMLSGRDVLIVYDDLTGHSHVHRALALLLGRPVGREAFPVDVFYAHASLLERATQLGRASGGGSLSALAVVETQAGDLSSYIPTNVVSITDGQVRLDARLAAAGMTPAVDVALSVSRVGGKAQPRALSKLAGRLKNGYAQFLELEAFARLGSRLERAARETLEHGYRVREALRQERGESLSWAETLARVLLLERPELRRLPVPHVRQALAEGILAARLSEPDAWSALERAELPGPQELERLLHAACAAWTHLEATTETEEHDA